jgi:small Trp-rich protein
VKIGLPGLIFIVFLILKLAEIGPVAHWSWWWVTSPLWIVGGIALILFAIAGMILALTNK